MVYIQYMCRAIHEHTGVDNPTYKDFTQPKVRAQYNRKALEAVTGSRYL